VLNLVHRGLEPGEKNTSHIKWATTLLDKGVSNKPANRMVAALDDEEHRRTNANWAKGQKGQGL
jgi:hypothetical protein